MKFVIDAHFTPKLKNWFTNRAFDAVHTIELPNANRTSDHEVANLAQAEYRIVLTKDIDFVKMRILQNKPDRILLVTAGNMSNRAVIKLFEDHSESIQTLFTDGAKVIDINPDRIIVLA
jgi:predicted nuclease of predicted toxin-antitoxin system